MLYAGTTSLYSFKYSIFIDKVKKLKRRSISAGNSFILYLTKTRTSETLRNEITEGWLRPATTENVKPVSVHVPNHLKPCNNNELGHYLASLIDGDGYFSSNLQLVIVFHSSDVSLAYNLKERLGFGNVRKVKNKNAILLIISNKKGLENIINLINGKIRTESKFNQIKNNILSHPRFADFAKSTDLKLNLNADLKNHWLAGFTDADGCFQIKTIIRRPAKSKGSTQNKIEIRLNFQIDQKKEYLLLLIKNFLGGNIGYRKSQDTYYYGSTSFGSAKKVINYFDYYHLQSIKHVNYLKWRKSYIIIQNKEHLTKSGIEKLLKLKRTMINGLPSVAEPPTHSKLITSLTCLLKAPGGGQKLDKDSFS